MKVLKIEDSKMTYNCEYIASFPGTVQDGCDNEYEDDVLRFLELSPPPLPPLQENELTDVEIKMPEPPFWDFSIKQPSTSTVLETMSATDGAGGSVPPKLALDCRECMILREIVHSNGSKIMRLSIHGTVGRFYHAMMDVSYYVDGYSSNVEHSYIDILAGLACKEKCEPSTPDTWNKRKEKQQPSTLDTWNKRKEKQHPSTLDTWNKGKEKQQPWTPGT